MLPGLISVAVQIEAIANVVLGTINGNSRDRSLLLVFMIVQMVTPANEVLGTNSATNLVQQRG